MNEAEAISAVKDDFLAAMNAGDVDAFMAIMTDDGVVMPANGPAAVGKDAIRSYAQDLLGQFTVKETKEIVDYKIAGEWAFARGAGTWTVTPKTGGETIVDTYKDLWVLKRQPDGSWKVYCGIYNSDNPVPQE